MATVYRSKIDWWLLTLLLAAAAVSVWRAVELLSHRTGGAWLYAAALTMIGAGLPVWLLISTSYTLGASELLVQSGPFKWRIAVATITGVAETRNPLSSPALSLDRLRLDYGHFETLMISPQDKVQFLRELDGVRHGVQPNNSSKPTPLRGAA